MKKLIVLATAAFLFSGIGFAQDGGKEKKKCEGKECSKKEMKGKDCCKKDAKATTPKQKA